MHWTEHPIMLVARGRGEDGTEFSPFASVLGTAEAERCQAGHVALPAPSVPLAERGRVDASGHAIAGRSPLGERAR